MNSFLQGRAASFGSLHRGPRLLTVRRKLQVTFDHRCLPDVARIVLCLHLTRYAMYKVSRHGAFIPEVFVDDRYLVMVLPGAVDVMQLGALVLVCVASISSELLLADFRPLYANTTFCYRFFS